MVAVIVQLKHFFDSIQSRNFTEKKNKAGGGLSNMFLFLLFLFLLLFYNNSFPVGMLYFVLFFLFFFSFVMNEVV